MFLHSQVGQQNLVQSVRQFALCISTAPRLAATFGSFWSRQKELAEGREYGEKWYVEFGIDIVYCFIPLTRIS